MAADEVDGFDGVAAANLRNQRALRRESGERRGLVTQQMRNALGKIRSRAG